MSQPTGPQAHNAAIAIDADRLHAEIESLAQISDTPYPSVTRILFGDTDMRARTQIKQLCLDAGLVLREDAVGNLFARWPGANPDATPIATGSHTDAIPNAGRFDGVVGVLGALEAIRALKRAGFAPQRSIDLIMFTAEEPTRFGIGCLGSRLMSGVLTPERGDALCDSDGISLAEARAGAGYHGDLARVRLQPGAYNAFIELHIEQGVLLEQRNLAIGVVTAIAAPATIRARFTGEGGHAGTVLMPDRHDPVLAAAETMLEVDHIARGTGSSDSVATCGLLRVLPGAVNSIPRDVTVAIDVRDIELDRRDGMVRAIRGAARAFADARGCGYDDVMLNSDPPATCGDEITSAITSVCAALELSQQRQISRAYHDALFMALICPTGMIFIPSRGGFSHRPDEFTSLEHIVQGVQVLAGTLVRLAG